MSEKISVIVPVYNSIDCLEKCVKSICAQTYTNLEILLIDDGSTDGTDKLCERLAAKDSRIRTYHKKNGGASSARNVGIRLASGEYLGFVDSDDYIEPDMYELMMESVSRRQVPIVQISRDEVDEAGGRLPDVCVPPDEERFCKSDDFLKDLLLHKGDCSFCTKLVKCELFEKHRFPEGVLNEDFSLLVEMLQEIDGITILPKQCYHVVCRQESTTRKKTQDSFSRVFLDIVDNADKVQELVDRSYPKLHPYAIRFNLYQRLDYLLHVPISQMTKDNEFYCNVIRYLRGHMWDTMANPYLAGKNKVYLLLLTIAPGAVRRIHAWKIARRISGRHIDRRQIQAGMREWQDSDRKKYLIVFVVIWVVQMTAAFYFCMQKQGFHEDEYYTYYSTARTNGFYVEDRQWMDRETYRNEFVVLPEQRFQYGLVKLVQSWDVHPPMYYWVFHTVASFMPNVFSKWIGLSVNLFFHGVNIILLTCLSYLVAGRDRKIPLFVTLFFGLSPAALSGVAFIRMYEMLTTFVLLCGILHIYAVKKNAVKLPVIKCLVPMAAVTYLGFLTQYYYFIFLFYLAIAFCVWLLLRDKNIWNCLRYGISQGIAFVLAYLTYPSCLGQMFRGQRGAQATENFFDWSNTFMRLRFFYDLMDRYVFGHLLSVLLLLITVFAVTAYRWNRRDAKSGAGQTDGTALEKHAVRFAVRFWMLAFTAAGYFLTVSKTALLLGDTSVRYQLPIYGIVILLLFMAVKELWRVMTAECTENGKYSKCMKYTKSMETAAVILCFAAILLGHWKDGVVFLYPEDKEQTAYAEECAAQDTPAVYLYQTGEEWCVWDVTDELFLYPEVYFAAAENESEFEDNRICNAGSLVVYLAQGADKEAQIERILDSNQSIKYYQLVFEEKYCNVYYFY